MVSERTITKVVFFQLLRLNSPTCTQPCSPTKILTNKSYNAIGQSINAKHTKERSICPLNGLTNK